MQSSINQNPLTKIFGNLAFGIVERYKQKKRAQEWQYPYVTEREREGTIGCLFYWSPKFHNFLLVDLTILGTFTEI